MREHIKFAWGNSSLGHFLVAVSNNGIVTLEFGEHGGVTLDALRANCPNAEIMESQEDLATIIAKLADIVEQPGIDPGLALDMRGSEYQRQVWTVLREIPAGETTSYGALAQRLGTRDARDVTTAIAANPIAILIPCHRVIKKDGSLSGYRWGARRKRVLLERERRLMLRQKG
ncbi:methylated-DNA--[protein]-cysteine S-methyltransferase [Pseudaminobacter soli (ex Li et al. 2025)]|uniref:methylated-DNA--[protein]-cysteine S-methyltransferase n=1 Tax=Pseudaminobacter soli (ex Li et al. 2025) TaxID=1295366 RepID=A0A2P7SKW7_9HYPH|nr:methylated-DNA--[protein]-cysteine S-methyltransferase [Mesorhizobium soli]PSJ63140.1 cysteine methyltransferase [Mesorhizobium soli]